MAEKGTDFLLHGRKPEELSQDEWENDLRDAVKRALAPLPDLGPSRELGLQRVKFAVELVKLTEAQKTVEKHMNLVSLTEVTVKPLLQEIIDYNNTHNRNNDKTVPDADVDAFLKTKIAAFKFASATEAQAYMDALLKGQENLRITVARDVAVYLAERSEFLKKYRRTAKNQAMAANDAVDNEKSIPNFLSDLVPLDAEERSLLSYANIVFPMQHNIAAREGLTEGPSELAPDAAFLLTIALQKHLSVETALAFADPVKSKEETVNQFLAECGYPAAKHPELVHAAKLLLGYIAKYSTSIQAATEAEHIPVQSLTIADALHLAGKESIILKLADTFIQSGGQMTIGSVEAVLKQSITEKRDVLSAPKVLLPASTYGQKLEELKKTKPDAVLADVMTTQDQDQYVLDVKRVEEFMVREHGSLKVSHMRHGTEDAVIQKNLFDEQRHILRSICDAAQTQETFDLCKKALTSSTTSTTEWLTNQLIGDLGTKTEAALEKIILQGNMTIRDAFELYYINHSEDAAKGTGTFALRMKVLSLLKNNGYATLADEWMGSITSDVTLAARNETAKIADALSKYGLTEEQMLDIQDVMLTLKEKGYGYGEGMVVRALRAWGKDPLFWTIIGAIGAGGTVAAVMKLTQAGAGIVDMQYMARMILPSIKTFAYQKDLAPLLKKLQQTNPSVTMTQLEEFQKEVRSLYEGRTNFVYRLPSRIRQTRLARSFLINRGKDLNTIANAMYSKPGSGLTGRAASWAQKFLGLQYYTNVDDVTRFLVRISPNSEEAVRNALKSIGQTDAEAQTSIDRVLRGTDAGTFTGNPLEAQSFDTGIPNLELPEINPAVDLTEADLELLASETLDQSKLAELAQRLEISLQSGGKAKSAGDLKADILLKLPK